VKFFGSNPAATLGNVDLFLDHLARLLGNTVYCAFTCEPPRDVSWNQDRTHAADSPTPVKTLSSKPIWPSKISYDFAKTCAANYHKNFQWKRPECCSVCARRKRRLRMNHFELHDPFSTLPKFFNILCLSSSHRHYDNPHFRFDHPALDRHMFYKEGIQFSVDSDGPIQVIVCNDCLSPLKRSPSLVPKYSLMNHLYQGQLPERFKDLTWLEEQVCALAHPGHNVFRLYFSDDPQQPYLAKGNCCVHPQPTRSTRCLESLGRRSGYPCCCWRQKQRTVATRRRCV